jgi:hypothetical protein
MSIVPMSHTEPKIWYSKDELSQYVGRVPRPVFGVAAESGGNQRTEWIFMARRGRKVNLVGYQRMLYYIRTGRGKGVWEPIVLGEGRMVVMHCGYVRVLCA